MKRIAMVNLGFILCLGLLGVALAADALQKSVTGTLIDTYCNTVVGAHGASHKQCAIACAKKGIPVGLEEKGTGKVFVLLPNKNAQALPDDVIDKMEDEVTVTGHEYSKGETTFLTVESVK